MKNEEWGPKGGATGSFGMTMPLKASGSCLAARLRVVCLIGLIGLAFASLAAEPGGSDATESKAIASAGFSPSSRPATGASTVPSSGPTTEAAWPYVDVSRQRHVSTRPAALPRALPVNGVSDAQIERSIRLGLELLLNQFDPKTYQLNRPRVSPEYEALECGLNALCVYATLQAGLAVNDPRFTRGSPWVVGLLEGAKSLRADRGRHQVYARSIRALALSVFNREEDRQQLTQDVLTLAYSHDQGGYRYSAAELDSEMAPTRRPQVVAGRDWVDHSNTQYGLLGVWTGAEAGIEIPRDYWRAAIDHWTATQALNGGWSYIGLMSADAKARSRRAANDDIRFSMTAAGAASLFVARQWVEEADGLKVGRDPFGQPLRAALKLLESADLAVEVPRSGYWGYTLYGVERVGLASGFKFLGDTDWFRVLARQAIDRQRANGGWDDLIESAYALAFLSRGRPPILMNKLRYDRGNDDLSIDFWANRPHDIDYLARFASRQLERPLNWQVVPLARPHTDWLDAPILAIGGSQRLSLREADIAKLRAFVEAGGMIFTNADADAPDKNAKDPLAQYIVSDASDPETSFDRYVSTLAAKLFPEYRFEILPDDQPIYSVLYKVKPRPKLRGVSNGARLLLVHSLTDLSRSWQNRNLSDDRFAFELGVNMYLYAAGKQGWRYRLDSPHVPEPGAPSTDVALPIARLKYAGNWSPEPGAWSRFARLFGWKTGYALTLSDIALANLKPGQANVATLTGTAAYTLTPAERARVKAFVEAGGVLLVDDCGGSGAFARAVEPALSALLAPAAFAPLAADHPLLAGGEPGMADGLQMKLRLGAVERSFTPKLAAIKMLRSGKGAVILCPIDLTSGLLGTQTWAINGYTPEACEAFARNVVLWTADGAK